MEALLYDPLLYRNTWLDKNKKKSKFVIDLWYVQSNSEFFRIDPYINTNVKYKDNIFHTMFNHLLFVYV